MYQLGKIKALKETKEGTELIIAIPEKIQEKVLKQKITKVELRIDDNRTITAKQRKKLYATIRDIAEWQGDVPEYVKEYFKFTFCMETGEEYFSLSKCSVELAKDFITFIIDFVLENNIPLSDLAINRTEDIDKYLYSCLKFRRCCITGKPNADIHHVTGSRVGMGRDRKKVDHSKLEIIALSREYHNIAHDQGEKELFEKYKIYGIRIDKETLKELNLNYSEIS